MTLVLLALAWLAGIAFVAAWAMPTWCVGAVLAIASPWAWLYGGRRRGLVAAAMAFLALTGAYHFYAWQHREPPPLAHFVEQSVVIEGVVASEPDPGATSQAYIVDVESLADAAGPQSARGRLRASLGQETRFLPGTRLRLTGWLGDPPVYEDFDYRHYLYQRDIVAVMSQPDVVVLAPAPRWSWGRSLAALRLRLDHALQRSLPEPEAALAGGIAFGRDGNLPDALTSDFRDTGLAHIVAVSGSNVSLVAGLVFGALTWLVGRKRAFWVVVPSVVAYVALAGLSASVVRAGIMAIVFVVGSYRGQPRSALAALAAAAIAMTAVQPAAAQDIGFQLSLAATAGLIVFAPWIRFAVEWLAARAGIALPMGVVQTVALTLSATGATMPIVIVNFGRLSLVGPLANVVVEPLFVLAFWLSLAAAAAGSVWGPAGWAIGLFAYYPVSFITWFARAAASVPFAAVDVPRASGGTALLLYAALCVPGWYAYRHFPPPQPVARPSRGEQRRRRHILLASMGTAVLVMAFPVSLLAARGPGELQVTLLDTAAGDALLVSTPHGKRVVIDGGPSGIQLAREVGAVLPHWEHEIDAVFALEPGAEHTGALTDLARRYAIAHRYGAGGTPLTRGDHFDIDGVAFDVLWPPPGAAAGKPDDVAVALRISYGGVSFLAVADLSASGHAQLIAQGDVQSTVLVLPHNGANRTDVPFIQAVAPVIGVVPVGAGPYASKPAPAVVEAFAGRPLFRTDEHGRITIGTDGQRISYDTAR